MLEGVGLELEESLAGGVLLGEGVGGFGQELLGEGRVFLAEGDEVGAQQGEWEENHLVMAERELSSELRGLYAETGQDGEEGSPRGFEEINRGAEVGQEEEREIGFRKCQCSLKK